MSGTPMYIRWGFARAIRKIMAREKLGPYLLADKLGTNSTQIYRWLAFKTAPSLTWAIRVLRRYPYAGQYLDWNVVRPEGVEHDSKIDMLGPDNPGGFAHANADALEEASDGAGLGDKQDSKTDDTDTEKGE